MSLCNQLLKISHFAVYAHGGYECRASEDGYCTQFIERTTFLTVMCGWSQQMPVAMEGRGIGFCCKAL